MKYIILLGDGMADFPLAELGGRTPLAAAHTPAMDAVAARGLCGLFCPIPDGMPPGSDVGNLSLFGYDPRATFTGRAPLEAANQGIRLGPNDVAFRCNTVTLQDGVMHSFTAGHITTDEARPYVAALNEAMADLPVRLHQGVSYRHLAIVTADPEALGALAAARCTPPHDITGQAYAPHLPNDPAAPLIRQIMDRGRDLLADHPLNQAREEAGKPPVNAIWLWGQGMTPNMDSYKSRFNITGAVISAVDLVNGIGVSAGLEVVRVPGVTGYLDTNYAGKVEAALDALNRHDFVYVHVEAPDETSHEGRTDLKIRAIEEFDARVVAPCLDALSQRDDFRVLVAPDHVTAISTKTHAGGPVPFALCGAGIEPNAKAGYSEAAAKATGLLVEEGYRLISAMITMPSITAESLMAHAPVA